jgi:ArsR family transcriptional regulator, arsenate/arsenite/antimonite-responsive transcriptional repressor
MKNDDEILRFAGMFAALGHEARLRIVRLLLSAHPVGRVVGEIQEELEIPASTLSHHLESLRHAGLVEQRREGKFLRYLASSERLKDLLTFLFAECCARSQVVPVASVTSAAFGACCP